MEQDQVRPGQYTYPPPYPPHPSAYTQQPPQWPYPAEDFPYAPFNQDAQGDSTISTTDQHGQLRRQSEGVSADQSDEASDDDGGTLQIRQYDPKTKSKTSKSQTSEWDRLHQYSAEGVAELREQWHAEYSDVDLPPPPPEIFDSKQAAIDSCKAFAKLHGYKLVVGQSRKDKNGEYSRVLIHCEYGGVRLTQKIVPPELRQRNRQSRKTGCLMQLRLQKKRFSDQWVNVVKQGKHNHLPSAVPRTAQPSPIPDLEAILFAWHTSELAQGGTVHGNTLRSKALSLYAEMPQYRGQEPPDLDRAWLDQYRLRYKLPGRAVRPLGPPELTNGATSNARAISGTPATRQTPAPTKESLAFVGLEGIFPPGSLLQPVIGFVRSYMKRYDASHDWDHILRVFQLARQILREEDQPPGSMNYDYQLVFLTALLHDVGDHKYLQPGENAENQIAEKLLEFGATPDLAMKIQLIAKNVSFSNEVKNPRMMKAVLDQHPELGIVQDADRLDAIGAVGIGRSFAFGGAKQPDRGMDGTIAHFTEKLERLEGMMKTQTGRYLARQRTERLSIFRQWWEEENAVMPTM